VAAAVLTACPTAAVWLAPVAGLVVGGGAVNGVNAEAVLDEPA
jgi:hypothetical protein